MFIQNNFVSLSLCVKKTLWQKLYGILSIAYLEKENKPLCASINIVKEY